MKKKATRRRTATLAPTAPRAPETSAPPATSVDTVATIIGNAGTADIIDQYIFLAQAWAKATRRYRDLIKFAEVPVEGQDRHRVELAIEVAIEDLLCVVETRPLEHPPEPITLAFAE